MKKCFVYLGILLFIMPLIAFSSSEKTCIDNSKIQRTQPHTQIRGTMLSEGFEYGFPPTGWDSVQVSWNQGGTSPCYWHQSTDYANNGTYGCLSGWGYAIDVWLRILSLDFSSVQSIQLSFWWESSYYWHVSPYDNGDMFVEVSPDGGSSWDIVWTFGDSAMVVNSGGPWPWTSWTWYQATLNLDYYAGLSDVYIAWHNVSDDNADQAFDDVQIDTILLGVGDDGQKNNPYHTTLYNAKPNPAKGNTVIYFNLSKSTDAGINVYDRSGRLIRNLINGPLAAGAHSIEWDCRDNFGKAVPSGVYFYRLNTSEFNETKNIIILQ